MNAVLDNGRPSTASDVRDSIRSQVNLWCKWMDGMLDIHRANFVFREASPIELQEHRKGFKEAIRASLIFYAVIADPEFNQPDMASRLQIRIRQLQDAYDTFLDPSLSAEQAEKILKQVFP
jgi:hypothetical protein